MSDAIPGESPAGITADDKMQALKKVSTIVYALQAGGFLIAYIPHIVAAVVIYQKKDEAAGTWLESHFKWQLRTFWFGLLWAVIGFILVITIVGIVVGIPIMIVNGIWIIYRVVKGWIRQNDGKQMYANA